MTPSTLDSTLANYAAGLDASLELLSELHAMAGRQEAACADGRLHAAEQLAGPRARVLEALLTQDGRLAPLRATVIANLDVARTRPGFAAAAARHASARETLAAILEADARTKGAINASAAARRELGQTLELGGATLAAYRRIIAPPPEHASIVRARG